MALTKASFAGGSANVTVTLGDPNRSAGGVDSKTAGLLKALGTPTKAVKAGRSR